MLLFIITAVIFIAVILLALGMIGPEWLKQKMRRQVRWNLYDASPFFPLDPYKPATEALKEGAKNFWPTKQRMRNYRQILLGQLLLTFGLFALVIFFYIFWQAR